MRAAIAKMAAPWHMYAEQCEYERGCSGITARTAGVVYPPGRA